MGRPKTVNKKSIRSIRFDDEEWSLIQNAAEVQGLDISKFIRSNLRVISKDTLNKNT